MEDKPFEKMVWLCKGKSNRQTTAEDEIVEIIREMFVQSHTKLTIFFLLRYVMRYMIKKKMFVPPLPQNLQQLKQWIRFGLNACFAILRHFSRKPFLFHPFAVYSRTDGDIQECKRDNKITQNFKETFSTSRMIVSLILTPSRAVG